MAKTALFDFFEIIAEELCKVPSRVITRADLQDDEDRAPVLDELKAEFGAPSTADAVRAAVDFLTAHFQERGSRLPFTYDADSGRFNVLDMPYLTFIKEMKS